MADKRITMIAVEKMTIRVPREFKRKVRRLARQQMVSDSDIIRQAVLKYIAAHSVQKNQEIPA